MGNEKRQGQSAERDYSPERIIKMAKPYREQLHLVMMDFRMDHTQRMLVLSHLADVIKSEMEIVESKMKSEDQDA
jgi:hypothetical protein